jgi:hypothetical protein
LWGAVLGTILWLGPILQNDPISKIVSMFKLPEGKVNTATSFQTILIVLFALGLAIWLAKLVGAHVQNKNTRPDIRRTLSPNWSKLLPVIVPAALGGVLFRLVPWSGFVWPTANWCAQPDRIACGIDIVSVFFSLVWVKLAVAGTIWYGIKEFGVSYFGDVARYVDTSHAAIAARSAIRERAVKLLGTLHDARAFKNGVETRTYEYDRIIIVAHSLGSVVAYDAMRIFWAQRNNEKSRVLVAGGLTTLREMGALVGGAPAFNDTSEAATTWDKRHYALQKKAFNYLIAKNADWRISDFVTLGSPLARADFLMSRDLPRFRKNIIDRVFPTSPPVLEGDGGFLFKSAKAGGQIPHHAAMFSVTQWLAIFDPVRGALFGGDFIGGPVRFLFGRGVSEMAVRITRRSWVLPNMVTHTDYWNANVDTKLDLSKTNACFDIKTNGGTGQLVIDVLRSKIWPG